jgi:O-antigen/teichoic acid export membrane protein
MISTVAVTYYAIGNSLCRYASLIISSMVNTFTPAASTYEASGDTAGLLMLYKNGTRAMITISLPMLLTMILRGPTFIGLWMGPQYSHRSGVVLTILSIALFFASANRTATSIAFGMGKHRAQAMWAIGEGVANLTLSVILARPFGIYGVALGTMVPNLFAQLVFWPGYVSQLVGLSRYEVFRRIWGPVILSAIPYAIATYCVERFFPVHSLGLFFLQVAATLPVFLATIALVFRSFVRTQVFPKVRSLLAGA